MKWWWVRAEGAGSVGNVKEWGERITVTFILLKWSQKTRQTIMFKISYTEENDHSSSVWQHKIVVYHIGFRCRDIWIHTHLLLGWIQPNQHSVSKSTYQGKWALEGWRSWKLKSDMTLNMLSIVPGTPWMPSSSVLLK
jgi:hypothetical protein